MKDKYQCYWRDKTGKYFYQVTDKNILPRWRGVILYRKIYFPRKNISKYEGVRATESVDYLRLYCEKISESEFKKFIK